MVTFSSTVHSGFANASEIDAAMKAVFDAITNTHTVLQSVVPIGSAKFFWVITDLG